MSSEPVISVRGLGKCYHIFHSQGARLAQAVTGRKRSRDFWALRDVSFDVHPGDAVGIIGRNGSGKSTLMQVIAGTLTPTEGEVRIRGRIAALLELGSGFNPHFTGRENVILSGAIMGVGRRRMEEKLPEIEEFAEVGDFLDEPVSVYSSGMHARLAFAVSVSLEPDILILDEILSVGDAGFQQRCIGRLHQLLASGVTLLFVSHAADAVKSICSRGLLLEGGRAAFVGSAGEAVNRYSAGLRARQSAQAVRKYEEFAEKAEQDRLAAEAAAGAPGPESPGDGFTGRSGTGHARFEAVRLLDSAGRERAGFAHGEAVTVELSFRAAVAIPRLDAVVRIRDKAGVDLFGASANEERPEAKMLGIEPGQTVRARFTFTNTLRAGPHGVCVTLVRPPDSLGAGIVTLDHIDAAAAFDSLPRGEVGKLVRGKLQIPWTVDWSVEPVSARSPVPVRP
jgi:lipopolysaccharide transport system ATP-binding protein